MREKLPRSYILAVHAEIYEDINSQVSKGVVVDAGQEVSVLEMRRADGIRASIPERLMTSLKRTWVSFSQDLLNVPFCFHLNSRFDIGGVP